MYDINALDRILDQIVKETLEAMERRKTQVYNIAENSRGEMSKIHGELDGVKAEISDVTRQIDMLTFRGKKALLFKGSGKVFQEIADKDNEDDHDEACALQIETVKLRAKEKLLRSRRDHLEALLQQLQATIERAEKMISHVGVVNSFLGGRLQDLSSKIGELQQAQKMAFSIIKAQEEERKRVAREIHDGPAQSMANIVMRAEYCLKLLDINPGQVREELVALQDLVRLSLVDVRKIIFDLRPMVLDDLGLVPAIKRYLADYKEQNGLQIEFLFFGQQHRLDSSIEVALFRIIQETVNNAKKHALAKNVVVKMEQLTDKVTILIKDNGQGFDLDKVMSDKDGNGYGLVGMRERVQLLEGEMSITTAPDHGTSISILVPLNN